jgi:hypothetical protein
VAKAQHAWAAQSPDPWSSVAANLERAAELLWEQGEKDQREADAARDGDEVPPYVMPAAMMLAGFTVEVLLKGLCVAQEPGLNKKAEFAIRTHNLPALAERAGFPVDADAKHLLERLQVFMVWAGRYPIPLKHEDLFLRAQPGGGFSSMTTVIGGDRERWRSIVRQAQSRLS